MEPDLYTQEDVKKILIMLYGDQANNWKVNEKVVLLVLEMMKESKACSNTMDYVPLPLGPSTNTLKKVLTNEVKQVLKSFADDRTKVSCLNFAKSGFRTRIETAAF